MSNIVLHHFGSNIIRVIDHDGTPWFVLDDIRAVFGVPWFNAAEHLSGDEITVADLKIPSGSRRAAVINLPGLYAVIALHKTTLGERFKRWVTTEFLPAILSSGRATVLPQPRDKFSSTSAIAHTLGMSPGKLGRRVNHLKTAEHGEWHPVVGKNSDKPVEQWFWNAAGHGAIWKEFCRRSS